MKPVKSKTKKQILTEYNLLTRYISRLYNTFTPIREIKELYRLAEIARDNELKKVGN